MRRKPERKLNKGNKLQVQCTQIPPLSSLPILLLSVCLHIYLFIYLFKVNLPNKQVRFLMSITYILGL